ncbi:hypothetical protein DBR17_01115 [Sphingomonas sp. HMWF008]|nr:hypothetical protein DBR17_01115 [Sphingomonas sp. HMWF008]
MTRISNADQVLLLLQEQIGRLAKNKSAPRGTLAAKGGTPEPMARVRALAAREGLSEEDLKRALVRGILVQQLGDAVGNDPAFEAIAHDVIRIIGEAPEGRDLLERALGRLSTPRAI